MISIENIIQGIRLLACTTTLQLHVVQSEFSNTLSVHENKITRKMKKGHETSMPRQKECEKGTKSQIKIA